MSDDEEPSASNFIRDVQEAYKPVAARMEQWASKFNSMKLRIANSGQQAEALANEHRNLMHTLAQENYQNYAVVGPTLTTRIYTSDREIVEAVLLARLEVIQNEILDHLAIFDQWDEALEVFAIDFKHHVEDLFGEGSAKEIA